MNTLSQIRTQIQSDLNASTNSSLFPSTTIDAKINRAYIKVAGFVRWPDLEDSKTSSTQANQDYYDVPDTFKYNSVWRVTVNNVVYGDEPDGSPMDFKDYLEWKRDNVGSTNKKWTQYRNQIFIYPTPTAPDLAIVVWGQANVTELSDDADTTIFSSNIPEVNEAILLEAEAMLQRKGEKKDEGQFVSAEAKQIVVLAFNKIKMEKAKYEKGHAMFNVPNFFGTTQTAQDTIGNFPDYK